MQFILKYYFDSFQRISIRFIQICFTDFKFVSKTSIFFKDVHFILMDISAILSLKKCIKRHATQLKYSLKLKFGFWSNNNAWSEPEWANAKKKSKKNRFVTRVKWRGKTLKPIAILNGSCIVYDSQESEFDPMEFSTVRLVIFHNY